MSRRPGHDEPHRSKRHSLERTPARSPMQWRQSKTRRDKLARTTPNAHRRSLPPRLVVFSAPPPLSAAIAPRYLLIQPPTLSLGPVRLSSVFLVRLCWPPVVGFSHLLFLLSDSG
ncbi:hypothetical protein LY76DRAFT_258129 [Colletotrichum caudatum]|nr:hypothetical protein LY76DRAFT_258129 [Colletotrichum caudatum]